MPCRTVNRYQGFERSHCLHLQRAVELNVMFAVPASSVTVILLGVHGPQDERTTVLRNISNYLPVKA
jgi:hypothetical protein